MLFIGQGLIFWYAFDDQLTYLKGKYMWDFKKRIF